MEFSTRREFLRVVGTGVAAAATGFPAAACGNGRKEPLEQIQSELHWSILSPRERINKLELKNHPKVEAFDPKKELQKACAEYYCQVVPCKKSPSLMADSVIFVDSDLIIEEMRSQAVRPLRKGDEDNLRKNALEFVSRVGEFSGRILMNAQAIAAVVERQNRDSGVKRALFGHDAEMVIFKAIFMHAYSHLNQSDEVFDLAPNFSPIQLQDSSTGRNFRVDRMESFKFIGTEEDGSPLRMTEGLEAMTEYVASSIGEQTGPYINLTTYQEGKNMIAAINKKAGVSLNEFIQYYIGKRPAREFLRRWGAIKDPLKPDEQASLLALLFIAVTVNGRVEKETAKRFIESALGQKIF